MSKAAKANLENSDGIIDSILAILVAENGQTSISYLKNSIKSDGYNLPSGTVEAVEVLESLGFTVDDRKWRWTVSL